MRFLYDVISAYTDRKWARLFVADVLSNLAKFYVMEGISTGVFNQDTFQLIERANHGRRVFYKEESDNTDSILFTTMLELVGDPDRLPFNRVELTVLSGDAAKYIAARIYPEKTPRITFCVKNVEDFQHLMTIMDWEYKEFNLSAQSIVEDENGSRKYRMHAHCYQDNVLTFETFGSNAQTNDDPEQSDSIFYEDVMDTLNVEFLHDCGRFEYFKRNVKEGRSDFIFYIPFTETIATNTNLSDFRRRNGEYIEVKAGTICIRCKDCIDIDEIYKILEFYGVYENFHLLEVAIANPVALQALWEDRYTPDNRVQFLELKS